MRKQIYKLLALAGGLTLGSLPIFSQTHDLDFKVRELTNGTGANISGVKVELDDGKYIGFTDANGIAHIHDVVDGTHRVNIAKEGYIQFLQDGYVLSSNQNFNASIIKKDRGGYVFNVSWWRQTFANVGMTMRNKDPLRWDHTMPVYDRISPTPTYTYADSINIVAAIDAIKAGTGYPNIIELVSNSITPDTTYTIFTHSGNYSTFNSLNGIIYKGYSQISVTTPIRRILHEALHQFDMWPITSGAYVSVMEPNIAIMADPQLWDWDHLRVTMYQHLAKRRGEQDLFLGNMMEYVTPTTPVATALTSPIDGATDLEALVRFMYNNSPGTDRYHMDIATDIAFSNIIKDLLVHRTDTAILLNDNQQYYIRIRAENIAGNSAWSSIVGFHTSISTSTNDHNTIKTISVFPNPFSDFITISAENKTSNLRIELFMTDGRLVKQICISNPGTIDLSELTSGLYHIRISNLDNSLPAEILTIIKN